MRITVPVYVAQIIQVLEAAGHATFVVGGCLRDMFLARTPLDWDLATGATTEDISQVLSDYRLIATGLRFGTLTVLHSEAKIEISVMNGGDIRADLARRDFTINAMAWSPAAGLIDPYDGQADIRSRVLRLTCGQERLREDPLRLLRALRFAVGLDFTIDAPTLAAVAANSYLITQVSAERIRDELNRILLSPQPVRGLELVRETGLLDKLLPELAEGIGFAQHHPAHSEDVYGHTLLALAKTPPDLIVRWAALLHDIAKPRTFSQDEAGVGHFYGHEKIGGQLAAQILRRLRFDNKTITQVKTLVENHMLAINYPQMRPGKLLARVRPEEITALFALQRADMQATAADHDMTKIDAMAAKVQDYLTRDQPIGRADLAINGRDLISLGLPQGPELGRILAALTEAVLENPQLNEREQLLAMARRLQ